MVDTHSAAAKSAPGIREVFVKVIAVKLAEHVDDITCSQNFAEPVSLGVCASWLSNVAWIYWDSGFFRFLPQFLADCTAIGRGVGKVCVFGSHILRSEINSNAMHSVSECNKRGK